MSASSSWIAGLCLLAFAACSGADDADGQTITGAFVWDDEPRTYQLHVPDTYQASEPAPLLLAFHGSNGTGGGFLEGTRLDRATDPLGFITVYPTSAVGNWAEGCGCNNADRLGIDDLGFTQALIDTVSAQYTIDPDRIYVVGFSQGGLYAQRVACEMSDQVAAVAVVAAAMSLPLAQTCEPVEPVSMLMLHGTEDTVLPYQGTSQGTLSLLSAPATFQTWIGHNDCSGALRTTTERFNEDLALKHEYHRLCEADTQVHLYTIEGGGHTWPSGDTDANEIVTTFFEAQSK